MLPKEMSKMIRDEIDEEYGTLKNFCSENKIGYQRLSMKLSSMKRGNDFLYLPILKLADILGYDIVMVKRNKKSPNRGWGALFRDSVKHVQTNDK